MCLSVALPIFGGGTRRRPRSRRAQSWSSEFPREKWRRHQSPAGRVQPDNLSSRGQEVLGNAIWPHSVCIPSAEVRKTSPVKRKAREEIEIKLDNGSAAKVKQEEVSVEMDDVAVRVVASLETEGETKVRAIGRGSGGLNVL